MKVQLLLCVILLGQFAYIRCDNAEEDASVEVEAEGEDCGCSATSRSKENTPNEEGETEKAKDEKPQEKEVKIIPVEEAKSNYPRTNQMVYIPKGSFMMGSNHPIIIPDGEGPARRVHISGFWYDVHEVSNAEFELFVNSTGYKTEVSLFVLFLFVLFWFTVSAFAVFSDFSN